MLDKVESGEYNKSKQVRILLQSNQPFTLRQEIATQLVVNAEKNSRDNNVDIVVYGAGAKSKSSPEVVFSEIGALFAEKTKLKNSKQMGDSSNKPMKDLLFQTRDNSSPVADIPEIKIEELGIVASFFEKSFD